jgi:hypothetical protein
MTATEWLRTLNERVFLFARVPELRAFLGRYARVGQDVIVLDTRAVLAVAGAKVEVSFVNTGSLPRKTDCRCRGPDTFVPFESWKGALAPIEEVTVVGGFERIDNLVVGACRHAPDGTVTYLEL